MFCCVVVSKDLGGFFKYVVVDKDLVLVDPMYMQEYLRNHPIEKLPFSKRKPMLCMAIKLLACAYVIGVAIHIILWI